ncbi:MAG TPA: alpha/beta hydrolase [Pilimelia sp.]|nr:alpha/beta hydrolase [Pilimelia sp.]
MEPARLHPQARKALAVQQQVPLRLESLAEVRRSMIDATPVEVGHGPRIRSVVEIDAGGVPARIYRDRPDDDAPVIVYAHGGGWVMGNLDTHDGLCRELAAVSGWAVLAVDYRLAPEHPYPAALEDMELALTWLRHRGAVMHGLDPDRVAVAGDSAGGHLAAILARRARDAHAGVAGQILLCPVIDPTGDYPTLDDYGLHRDEMRFFWDAYAPPGVDRELPDLDPLRADLTRLPPAVIVTAELDILRDEGERYAARLLRADVPVVSVRHQGMIHNFPRKLALFDAAHVALAQVAAAVHRW